MDSVAVIIPAYNGENYLGGALESVLRQTRPADEVIVVDDGSTDRTSAVAESFAGVTVLRQANRGVSAARNRAISTANSTWIAFLDADDVWRADKLELQMAALESSPDFDASTCNAATFHAPGDPAGFGQPPLRLPPSEEIVPGLRGSLRLPPGTVIARRELLLQVGGFDETSRYAEDWDLWLRMASAGCRFLVVPEDLLLIRSHATNASSQSYRMMDAELRVWERNIGSSFSPATRPLRRLQARSHFLGRVALVEREQNRPHVGVMARSLLLFPVGDWHRHKVFTHMLLSKAGILS